MNHPAALSGTESEHINSNSIQNKYGPCVTVIETTDADCSDVIESIELYAEKLIELRQEKIKKTQALTTQKEIRDKIKSVRAKYELIQNKVTRTDKETAFVEKTAGTSTYTNPNINKY